MRSIIDYNPREPAHPDLVARFHDLVALYESLRERRVLQTTAKHLVRQLSINIPVYEHSRRGMLLLRIGMIAYDLLSLGKPLPHHRVLNREEFLRSEPGVEATGLRGGVQYFDAQVEYAERLVIENVIAAERAGAKVCNYSPVTSIELQDRRVRRVFYTDRATGVQHEARARIVVNAAGPWVDKVLATARLPVARLLGGTKGSHIIVKPFAGAPKDAFYVEARADGRPFFIIPWNAQYLIGTTEIRYDGDPGEARASEAEVRYLLAETNGVFPQAKLGVEDIHYAYAGVRPLPRGSTGPESAITRKHIIMRHDDTNGLWTVIGGKLTTYRSLAEDAVDRIVKRAGLKARSCSTREENLPGADELEEAALELQALQQWSEEGRKRLLTIYGGRARRILELARDEPSLRASADAEKAGLAAEVAFTIRREFARNLVDILHRRTMAGLAPDLGASVAPAVAAAAADELGWSAAETNQQLEDLKAYNSRLAPARAE